MLFSARLVPRALARPSGPSGSLRSFAVLSHVWTGGQRPDASGPQKVCARSPAAQHLYQNLSSLWIPIGLFHDHIHNSTTTYTRSSILIHACMSTRPCRRAGMMPTCTHIPALVGAPPHSLNFTFTLHCPEAAEVSIKPNLVKSTHSVQNAQNVQSVQGVFNVETDWCNFVAFQLFVLHPGQGFGIWATSVLKLMQCIGACRCSATILTQADAFVHVLAHAAIPRCMLVGCAPAER
ncbi:unnamed protein product [Symbiodinium sp. CCMP2592]|nr:unnamed protein product [Symbiodinium sp. CCMP2592]